MDSMMLGELIIELEKQQQDRVLNMGMGNPHSYRGFYQELAFEPMPCVTIATITETVRNCIGKTFMAYKGGAYTMTISTYTNIAYEGETGDELTPTLLMYMLNT